MIGPWIAETQAKKVAAQAEIRTATDRRPMSRDEIEGVVTALGDLARVVRAADPEDKADIYAQLRLTLTYQPEEKLVQATIKPGLNMCNGFVSEARVAPYVHCPHRPDHGVYAHLGRRAMNAAGRVIRWSTAVAVLGVALVAAVVS